LSRRAASTTWAFECPSAVDRAIRGACAKRSSSSQIPPMAAALPPRF
jgi:hypothetical protein